VKNDTQRSSGSNSPLAELDKANLRDAMRAVAAAIAAAHQDVLSNVSSYWDGERISPITRPVVISIPADLCTRDLEVLVRHEYGGVLVDVREKPDHAWVPIGHVGGSFEER
jgi:hypothetical protein